MSMLHFGEVLQDVSIIYFPLQIFRNILIIVFRVKHGLAPSERINYLESSLGRIIIRVFCPIADPSLQAQVPRLQFCEGRSSTANTGTKAAVLPGIEQVR